MSQKEQLNAEITNLMHQDVDELSALLGQSDPAAEDTLHSFESARLWGEKTLRDLSESLHSAICNDWRYCERRKGKNFDDDVKLATAVAGLIIAGIGANPAAIIATILVKRGLDAFCECDTA
jgi:hypothetical protein